MKQNYCTDLVQHGYVKMFLFYHFDDFGYRLRKIQLFFSRKLLYYKRPIKTHQVYVNVVLLLQQSWEIYRKHCQKEDDCTDAVIHGRRPSMKHTAHGNTQYIQMIFYLLNSSIHKHGFNHQTPMSNLI